MSRSVSPSLRSFLRLLPALATRLVLSLKKAADPELGAEWRVDHFTTRIEQTSAPHRRSLSFELRPRARPSVGSRRLE